MQKEKPAFQAIPNWECRARTGSSFPDRKRNTGQTGKMLRCNNSAKPRSSRDLGEITPLCSLIIQVEYGTFSATDCDVLSLGSTEPGIRKKGEAMKRSMMAIAAAATLAVSALAAPAPAHAQRGVAAGVAAGLIGGALIGGALASPGYYGPGYGYYGGPRYYGPGYGYYGGPAYVAGPGYYGDCYWQRQRFWDGYGWRIRRVRVCG